MASKVIYADLDAWFANTLGGAGNGKGDRMGIGMGTGSWPWQNRGAIRLPRPAEMADIPSVDAITAFDVFVRASNNVFGIGGAVKFYWERGTTAFTEYEVTSAETGGANPRNFVSSNGPATGEWPAPTRETANRGEYIGAPANGDWLKTEMLAMGKWWYEHPEVTALILVGVASNGAGGYDESTTARRVTLYTRESPSGPYAELVWTDNVAPNIPTNLTPADGTKVVSILGTTADVGSSYTDPDGDTAPRYQAQWYPSTATDAVPGTPTKDNTVIAPTPHSGFRAHKFTGLPTRTLGKWRMRFFDGILWGAWSLLRTATTAFKPAAVNRVVEPGTLTPKLYASISSQDPGDFITAVQEFIYQDPAVGATITKWDSGKIQIGGGPTRSEVVYSGTPLAFGTGYRRRTIIWNRDDIPSDLTANQSFTQREPTGAVIDPSDALEKIDTLTPTFTLSDPTAADIDQARLWLETQDGTVFYDSGVLTFTAAPTKDIIIPAGLLAWGMNPKVYGAVRVSGNASIGPTSEKKTIHINVIPGTPYPVSISGGLTVQRPDGVWVTTDSTPDALFPFRDADRDAGYPESATRQEVEIRDALLAAFGASPYIDSTTPSETFTLPLLTVEETYDIRARYDDTAGARSDWSERVYVKHSSAPTLSSVTPASGGPTITDPTPTFAWTFASAGGKPQASYQLVAKAGETTLYDSGLVESTDGEVTMDPFVLPDDTVVTWTLTVYDSDGLYATVTRNFLTNFSQPAALTGLLVTPDTDLKALLVSWDESALPDNEFYAYLVYAKSEGGQFRLVTTITSKVSTSFYYRAAAHNRETVIRVSQTNGFAESEPVEATGIVGGEGDDAVRGYWLKRPEAVFEVKHIKHGPGDTQLTSEQFHPPSRGEAVILTWGSTGYEGSFSLFTDDRALIQLLRQWKGGRDIATGEYTAPSVAILATPYGESRYVRIMSTPDTDEPAGWITSSVSYISVSPSAADF